MKTIKLSIFFAVAMLFAFVACTKEAGFGGNAEISGTVKYDAVAVEGAIVYIAVGATEATTTYTTSTTTDATGAYSFKGLNVGDYFVDATFTDSKGFKFESGGALVKLGDKKGTATADLTVK